MAIIVPKYSTSVGVINNDHFGILIDDKVPQPFVILGLLIVTSMDDVLGVVDPYEAEYRCSKDDSKEYDDEKYFG